jgi:hypothetical protein
LPLASSLPQPLNEPALSPGRQWTAAPGVGPRISLVFLFYFYIIIIIILIIYFFEVYS